MYGFLLVFFSNLVPKTHRFWDIRLLSIQWPWNPGWGSLKVIENYTIQSGTHDFLLAFHSNHRPISHHFRDKRRSHENRQLKRCVDKLKSTYPSLAPITVFVISGLQSVTYWKNFSHVWWLSYGLYVISCICTLICVLFSGILVHLVATLTGYVDILLIRIVFLESIVR